MCRHRWVEVKYPETNEPTIWSKMLGYQLMVCLRCEVTGHPTYDGITAGVERRKGSAPGADLRSLDRTVAAGLLGTTPTWPETPAALTLNP